MQFDGNLKSSENMEQEKSRKAKSESNDSNGFVW